ATGHLVFVRGNALYAQRFDPDKLEMAGEPAKIADQIRANVRVGGSAAFSISDTGILTYVNGSDSNNTVAAFDRSGRRVSTIAESAEYVGMSFSPDDNQLAVHQHEIEGGGDIWIRELDRGTNERISTSGSHNTGPLWSPDGKKIIFDSNRNKDSH